MLRRIFNAEFGEIILGYLLLALTAIGLWAAAAHFWGFSLVAGIAVITGGTGLLAVFTPAMLQSERQEQRIDSEVAAARRSLGLSGDLQSVHYRSSPEGANEEPEQPTWSGFVASNKVQPAWDVARGTLEKYWARNLSQNGFIFVTSIIASALGFSLTLWGVYAAIHNEAALKSGILAASSGAVTQIIGATFLVIYRSTAQQALEFNRTLERINSVGMAWYVLQTMSEETDAHKKAKDAAKAALVLSVITASANAAVAAAASDKSDPSAPNSKEKKQD